MPELQQACPMPFDEGRLWKGADSAVLMAEVQSAFQNITRIMDCVGCEKCKLWGKLQTLGEYHDVSCSGFIWQSSVLTSPPLLLSERKVWVERSMQLQAFLALHGVRSSRSVPAEELHAFDPDCSLPSRACKHCFRFAHSVWMKKSQKTSFPALFPRPFHNRLVNQISELYCFPWLGSTSSVFPSGCHLERTPATTLPRPLLVIGVGAEWN